MTWRQHRVPCCRSVTVHRHSFLISAAYSKPSSFTVSEFFLETLIHVRRPSSVSSVVHLVTKPLILPVFVREWLQKYRPLQCGRSSLQLAPFFLSALVFGRLPSWFLFFPFLPFSFVYSFPFNYFLSILLKPLKTYIKMSCVPRFNPYCAVNTLRLGYTNQSVNTV